MADGIVVLPWKDYDLAAGSVGSAALNYCSGSGR